MITLPFDVKETSLIGDSVRGFGAIHPDALDLLSWVCDFSQREFHLRPMVTEFGRTLEDQEDLYYPFYLQAHTARGHPESEFIRKLARDDARHRPSWHVLDSAGLFRAFDLRSRTYSEPARQAMIVAAREKYPAAEVLHHRLPGNAWHFHFAARPG